MGFTARRDFSGGWQPNADAINAPPNAYLRGDNLILDEKGVLSLRRGSTRINSTPLADADVHSLYTTALAGTRYRMTGAGSAVYANGTSIASVNGSGDTSFGFHLGQILFARGTVKKKYDGTTVRNWGIAMTGAKATAAEDAADGKTFATGASGETPAFTAREGVAPTFGPGGANECQRANMMQLIVDNTSKRGTWDKVFAAPQDFTTYDSGTRGDDNDIISWFFSKANSLREVSAFAVQFDINDGTFTKDYFMSPVMDGRIGSGTTVDPHAGDPVPGQGAMAAAARAAVRQTFHGDDFGVNTVGFPVGSTDARCPVLIQFKRGEFTRLGQLTNGKGWDTVKAVRILLYQDLGISSSIQIGINIDTIRIHSAKLLGEVEWKYVYVRNASGYQARSGPSAASDKATFSTHAATVTVPADASRDSQVNEIWLYRKDQFMDQFYRSAVKTGVSGTGAVSISDILSSDDVLTLNLKLEIDNTTPPDNIIGIAGPHFDRTLVLTSDGKVWPSRKLDPDAFATGQVLSVGGADETPLWIFRAHQTLYVGTSKDIYEISGTGAENPDGSVEYTVRGLSMDHRSLNAGIAHEGDQLCFFADDGWRAFQGQGSTLLTGDTSLLYRGEVRHGVGPVNLSGRVRAALAKGQLVAITPEGTGAGTASCLLYRYVFKTGHWYRQPYATANWLSLHREPDGTLIAGDDAGTVWVLDTGTQDDGTPIGVTWWSKADDLDHPYQRKTIGDLMLRLDTGGSNVLVALHRNGSASASTTLPLAAAGATVTAFDLGNANALHKIASCRQLQFRLFGNCDAFHLYDIGVQFRERPIPIIGRVPDTRAGSPGVKVLSGLQLTCNTFGVARVITPFLDGVADSETFTIQTGSEEPETLTLPFTLTGRRAVDIGFAVDGELEVDGWSPIVTQRQPVGVKVWDSGPIDLQNNGELTWLRMMILKVRAGADLVITPYFDGTAFPTVTVPVTPNVDMQVPVPVGRAYVGRQPRIVVRSCEDFFPYWIRCYRRVTGTGSQKPHVTVPFTLESGGA